jgi:uncharacterized protein YbjT (DUF2867 family)
MTRILVTGATGNTGKPVFELLSSVEGIEVIGASRSGDNEGSNAGKLVRFDYTDRQTIKAALEGVDKVFLVTPFVLGMLEMEKTVIDEIKNSGIKHVVKLSVAGADAENGITFGKLHRELEKEIEQSGITYTHLRPMSFMQNYANFMSYTIQTQSAFYLPLGEGKVSVVDVRDIAAVALKVFTEKGHEGQAYTLTGPQALSNYEIAEILSTVTGRKINYVDVSAEQARESMKGAGMPDWNIERMLELYHINKQGYTAQVTNDIEQVTGTRPRTFEQYANDFKEAFL